jgi:hypothetical protein
MFPTALVETNLFFYNLYHGSFGLSDVCFLQVVRSLLLAHLSRITKPMAHIAAMRVGSGNTHSAFLIPRLVLDIVRKPRDDLVGPILTGGEVERVCLRNQALLQFFCQDVPELCNCREPELETAKLPVFQALERPRAPISELKHYGVSYIQMRSPLQSSLFAEFLFNSRFVSVHIGAERGASRSEPETGESYDQEDYFSAIFPVSTMQVTLANLKRSYGLLQARPLPEYNRFPVFLQRTIAILYEKLSKKVLSAMQDDYEIAAGVIGPAVREAILSIERHMPTWLAFMNCHNNLFASRIPCGYSNCAALDAMEALAQTGEFVLKMKRRAQEVFCFLRALAEEGSDRLNDSGRLFFDVLENLEIELLVMRPFAASLFVIPRLVVLFKEFDIQFNTLLRDRLSLGFRDRFLVREAETIVGIRETFSDGFAQSSAPLSMRMFLDYAVAQGCGKKDPPPEKLAFATHVGSMIMREIDTFFALLNDLNTSGEFIAICDLFYEAVQFPEIDYLSDAAMIMQGRSLYGISRRAQGDIVIRKVDYGCPFRLSPSFTFCIDWRGGQVSTPEPESQSDGSTV